MACILVVDDSSYQRRNIRKLLANSAHEILEAGSGQEALELIASRAPDCVLLDLLMPDVSGIEALQVLHELQLTIPVIVVTADIQQSMRVECLRLGAKEVLNKPVKQETLLDAISAVLAGVKDV